ncbi:hypothetical protein MKW94_006950 [Papaver nudicaule]|uniref:J domain-containing protein n=1 Tax=Papaver nudicaule TaxID=74823 RepID=A0AA41VYZ5_PAPNU|nr:hypothetical protein [Papaver nudicaule]
MAASTAVLPPAFPHSHNHNTKGVTTQRRFSSNISKPIKTAISIRRNRLVFHRVSCASASSPESELGTSSSDQQQKPYNRAPPGVDTRIHWDNSEDGWIGGSTTTNSSQSTTDKAGGEDKKESFLGQDFSDMLNSASNDSHYQFLGVSADADLEEIRAAYRRLSKEYHPDTTLLPLRAASDKFMKLRDIYDTLSNEETRRFYDWTLAQEEASRQAEKMRLKFEDPREQEVKAYVPQPDLVDRLGGKNLQLSDQAMSALTFDAAILVFSIFCIVYVAFFKDQ